LINRSKFIHLYFLTKY